MDPFRLSPRLTMPLLLLLTLHLQAAPLTIATWNLENYLVSPTPSRPAKSPESRNAIHLTLRQLNPDILALQEIGDTNALLELRNALRAQGLDYPHSLLAQGFDTNIHVALLSRLPIARHQFHDNLSFLLQGRRLRTSRAFLEAEFLPNSRYPLTLLTAHLKSRRESTIASQEEIREQEARVLRQLIDARLQSNPNLNLIVLGDLNDSKDSRSLRTLLGRGRTALTDTRPSELPQPSNPNSLRSVAWTHFFAREDSYSRVDYILLSSGMARELDRSGTFIPTRPDWGLASDHRPLIARFLTQDR